MSRPKLICIVGPTAVGKTSFAVSLAKLLDCEVLSSDARQCYKEMRIGTAVPEKADLAGVPHHFIQHKSIHEGYSVGEFEQDALKLLAQLHKKHSFAILVGGSNLYNDAVVKGLDYFPIIPKSVKEHWQMAYTEKGITYLQQELARLDPDYHATVDLHNHMRLLRALSVCTVSGMPYSSFIGQQKEERPFDVISIALTMNRESLYQRINTRVDQMIVAGLVDEVKSLLPYKTLQALQTVGYRELFPYLEGNADLNSCINQVKINTRRFAKRQLTWLRNHPCTHQIPYDTVVDESLLLTLGLKKHI